MQPAGRRLARVVAHVAAASKSARPASSSAQTVVVRPPLVYGPGVKGNLQRLMRLVARGVPQPFGAIDDKRSMIGLGNLVSATLAVLEDPAAAGRTFLVSDQDDLSTRELLEGSPPVSAATYS